MNPILADHLDDDDNLDYGNLSAFNELVYSIFGNKLYTPNMFINTHEKNWPNFATMRGKILIVICGDI